MKAYIITYKNYLTEEPMVSINVYTIASKAVEEAKILRANGHKNVKIVNCILHSKQKGK